MTSLLKDQTSSDQLTGWPVFFGKNTERNVDFDDDLEDFDYPGHKPPRRRPLVLILALLVMAGLSYAMINPSSFHSLTNIINTSIPSLNEMQRQPSESIEKEGKTQADISPSAPSFNEGQFVTVTVPVGKHSPIVLSNDSAGKQPGRFVKNGDLLTILDGIFLNNSWVYLVQTKSGKSGWINERHLQEK